MLERRLSRPAESSVVVVGGSVIGVADVVGAAVTVTVTTFTPSSAGVAEGEADEFVLFADEEAEGDGGREVMGNGTVSLLDAAMPPFAPVAWIKESAFASLVQTSCCQGRQVRIMINKHC